jgi:hypothetical protein
MSQLASSSGGGGIALGRRRVDALTSRDYFLVAITLIPYNLAAFRLGWAKIPGSIIWLGLDVLVNRHIRLHR